MTDAELTILSILAEGARYGHEIQQIIHERGLRAWIAVGFSSVYYILNKLERMQLVSSELRNEGRGPARKLYRLTDAGRGILQTAIVELIRQPTGLGTGFEMGLANLHVLEPPQVYSALVNHRDTLKYQLMAIERTWTNNSSDEAIEDDAESNLYALYAHSITRMKAEIDWIDDFLAKWLRRHPDANRKLSPHDPTLDAHQAPTIINRRPTPDPAKMLQRLKRPPRPSDPDETQPDRTKDDPGA
ncbi:MAG: PadR family transcriptional regulator [Anaerolineae bacterium]|nr:PadR family transcriptional regulator [Anaerolineae bacterium]MCA9891694.1 PadR family transcriptional regulator [Anaerolineae bacterium]